MSNQPAIIIDQANLGGIADSPYMGQKNSLAAIVGFSLHKIPGLLYVNQKMSLHSPTSGLSVVNDLVKILACSDGNIYLFGKTTGKVWKIDTNGVYTLLGTVTGGGIFSAREYFGYIYYPMAKYLGRWKVGTDFATRNDTYGTFQNGDTQAHPMMDQNLVLYIGDGDVVAQVDASGEPDVPTAFSPQALKVLSTERVTALGKQTTNLLIGTKSISNQNLCTIYNWNTWSESFQQSDPVPENGINAFMPNKLNILISAGENGNFYQYTRSFYGLYLEPLSQIPASFPNVYGPTQRGIIYPEAVDALQSIPIFGFSKLAGNPALQGIYSLGGRNTQYPQVLSLEYPISTGNLNNVTIWSIEVVGNDIYISWKDETPVNGSPNTAYGVDKLDYNNKITGAYFETRITKFTRLLMDRFKDYVVNYDQCPAGTSIDLYYNKNHMGYVKFTPDEFVNDTDRNFWKATQAIEAKTIQFKVVVNSNGNTAPNIEDAIIALG